MFTSDGGGLPGLPVGGLCDCFAVFAAELAELRHAWLTSPATLHLPADSIGTRTLNLLQLSQLAAA